MSRTGLRLISEFRPSGFRLAERAALAAVFAVVISISGCSGGSGAAPLRVSITTMSLRDGTVGTAYSQTIESSGGTGPYTWTVSTGSLPAGLSLGGGSANSVTISGTPNTAQNASSFTIEITDSKNQTATQAFSVNIQNPPGPVISTNPAPPAATATVPYEFSFIATGGLAPLVWSETGDLPSGMNLSNGGVLSGKPTVSGSFTFSIKVTDNVQQMNTIPIQLTVIDSGVSLERLKGHYAFLFQGHRPQLGLPFAAVASFVADGAGGINNGHIDTNAAGGAPGSDITFTGTYSFDTTDQGQMEIKNAAAGLDMVFRMVALGPEGSPAAIVRLTEFDTIGGGSALMQLQDSTKFNNAGIDGDYVFGLAGSFANGERTGAAGRLTANGSGETTNEKIDVNLAGSITGDAGFTFTYSIPAGSTSGRGTATLSATLGGKAMTLHFAVYVISATQAFLITSDTATDSLPLFSGATGLQVGSPFSNLSMKGNFVYALTGVINSGPNVGLQDLNIGLMTTDGAGGFSLTGDENSAATISTPQFSGTYSIDANGRVSITGEAEAPVLYLSGNVGFMVGTDSNASSGTFQRQTDDPVLKSTLGGVPAFFSGLPGSATAWNFTSITAFSGGRYFGTWDVGIAFFFPKTQIVFTGSYTIAMNGRGILNPGDPFQEAFYVVDKNTFIVANSIGTIDNNPGLEIAACQESGAAGFGKCP